MTTRVDPGLLRVRIDPATLAAGEPAELPEAGGQDRAIRALSYWATVAGNGQHLFAAGPQGIGRRMLIRSVIGRTASAGEPFPDWVYVNNFQDNHHPLALSLPFGTAVPFRDALAALIEDLAGAIPAAFESDDYKSRIGALEAAQASDQEERLADIRSRAEKDDIALIRTPMGFAFVPTFEGDIVKPEVFNTWPAARREEIQHRVEDLQEELNTMLKRDFPALERATRAQVRELNREVATAAIGMAVTEVRETFAGIDPIRRHLDAVEADLVEHFHLFLALSQEGEEVPLAARLEHPALRRYAVNVMDACAPDGSDADGDPCPPVIEEADPNYSNLVGRIEHQPVQGALVTDFTMIKPGALHRANGGFLVVDARDLLMQPFAYEALKRCLKTSSIRITSAAERLSLMSTISLEPDEIPLSVRVALIGDRRLYYLLSALDPDFPQLFKVLADFEDDIDRSDANLRLLAGMVGERAKSDGLQPFGADALAAVLEQSSRLADDAAKLSLRIDAIADLMREADHFARQDGADTVAATHVRAAIAEHRHRNDRLRARGIEMIDRGIVKVDVTGLAVGEINGLSVISLGETSFGRPSRISVRTRMGTGKIIDIEREVKLGGPIHSKGVLILSSFLATRYSGPWPLSLSASIVFEQSYGGIEGDSASSTELYALLSSLADVPVQQSLAVTGSVDQFGRVQAIGGVNEKIEGFYDVCAANGLTGDQGVLIPASNVQHLNLRPDVADAAAEGRFAIHAIDHIDTGIELLTGMPAGTPDGEGNYPDDTINGRVAARLAEYARQMQKLRARPDGEEEEPPEEDEA